jgi:hypothetical protein
LPRGRPIEPNSQRSIARRNGVSQPTVNKAIKRGRIDVTQPADVIDQAWKANADLQQMLRRLGIDHVPKDYAAAQTALEQLKVHEKALKLQQTSGTLIDREKANAVAFEMMKRVRESWEQWPARVAPEMAKELKVTDHAMQQALQRAVKTNIASVSFEAEDVRGKR